MENIIEVKGFSKYFGDKQVLKNISFSVKKGEIFAYLGSNGSGKTTTIRSLLDIYKADSGDLKILGQNINEDIFNKIGYLPEERGLYLDETVYDILYFFAKLKGLSDSKVKENIDKFLKRIDLEDKKFVKIKKLSSGQQQKIQLGVAIIHDPEILILDEPMKGLDPVNRQLFINIILEEKAKGRTILFSSHQMEDVEKMVDSLIILKSGEIAAYGKLKEVKNKYGENTIKLGFEGNFKENNELFEVKTITNNFVELKINDGISSQDILKYFLDLGLNINKFEFSEPSLNDIFISINK
ncbi:hypothetical protein BKN14_03870 [Candidatus Gracilibacteria bacterium HOT-871]|nr:hypothetical protein BKN14_03870 [Candidatus Gracilibacteria bacterium HOT-871]MBB1565277.1 ATP-binding cassette domain-containing protein [Candidatus Gracilibacteria bacterium]RKW21990.1 MAG: ATP-binding cassette domain-containing protein [Candidatus Gracilibacteria bacterium]